jgi:hypothetical protein
MTVYGVTGAPGHLGRLTVQQLLAHGVRRSDIVAVVRSQAKAKNLVVLGVELREADYSRPDTLLPGLAGIDPCCWSRAAKQATASSITATWSRRRKPPGLAYRVHEPAERPAAVTGSARSARGSAVQAPGAIRRWIRGASAGLESGPASAHGDRVTPDRAGVAAPDDGRRQQSGGCLRAGIESRLARVLGGCISRLLVSGARTRATWRC